MSNFSEDQLNRYEMYRRAAFPKASIKRVRPAVVKFNSFSLADQNRYLNLQTV